MGAEVIKEFLVSLGYRIEGGQEAKFKNSVEGVTKSVMALGAAAAAVSTAVSAAVIKIGQSLDSLYWQAQRVNATVGQIRSASYAISQLGGSVDGARSSIEGFGKQLKWNPGFEGYIKQLGVVTRENGKLRDSTVLAREFALTIAKLPLGVQKAHADLVGMDLPTLEALQSGDFAKHAAKHAETVRKLGVNEDEAAKKANALVQSLTSLNDTFTALGTLLVDRFGPGLTDFFKKIERFLLDNSENIVAFFQKLGKVATELGEILDKLLGIIGPLWQKFDNLAQSIAGTDGLTAALVGLLALKVAPWLLGVAAAITQVGTAASVALLGGALGKFMRLFGVGGAIAIGMTPTEANGGEDEEIARRRASGTFGPAKAGELEADAAKRHGSTPRTGQQRGDASAAPKDSRNLWQRIAPKMLGGKDAPERPASTAPIGGTSFGQKAPGVMKRLMEDFGFTKEQAAGVVGNLGQPCVICAVHVSRTHRRSPTRCFASSQGVHSNTGFEQTHLSCLNSLSPTPHVRHIRRVTSRPFSSNIPGKMRRVCVFRPSSNARTIGAENRMGRSRPFVCALSMAWLPLCGVAVEERWKRPGRAAAGSRLGEGCQPHCEREQDEPEDDQRREHALVHGGRPLQRERLRNIRWGLWWGLLRQYPQIRGVARKIIALRLKPRTR